MLSRTRKEVAGRVASAWHERDPGGVLKYGLAWTIKWSQALPGTGRRSVARARRLAGRARRRLAVPRDPDQG